MLPFLDCPMSCAKTHLPPDDPDGCAICPKRRGQKELEQNIMKYLRMFCGTKDGTRHGEPNTDGWSVDDLRIQVGITSQINAELEGKGYPPDADDLTIEMLNIFRDEERKLEHRAWNKPDKSGGK
jgi:hypothetical protein